MKKLVMISLIITALISQIGCGFVYDQSYKVCNPDRFVGHDDYVIETMERKYNGEIITLQDTMRAVFNFGNIKIKDGVAEHVDVAELLFVGTDYEHEYPIEISSIEENTEKVIPLNVEINANYYSISNISNGSVQTMVPVSDNYNYQGWLNDTSAILQYGYFNNGYEIDNSVNKLLLHVTDIANIAWEFESYSEMQKPKITTFPDISPLGDLQMNLETTKIWTGNLTIKIIQNSDSIFRIQKIFTLNDGTNTFEQTSNQKFKMSLAECHTEHYN